MTHADAELKALQDDIAKFERLDASLTARIEPLQRELEQLEGDTANRPLTGDEERRKRDLGEAIGDLDVRGEIAISPGGHISRRLSRRDVRARLEQLRTKVAEAQAAALIDPNEKVRVRLSRMARHYVDGRLLKVGEETELTRSAFATFGDRFELVSP